MVKIKILRFYLVNNILYYIIHNIGGLNKNNEII